MKVQRYFMVVLQTYFLPKNPVYSMKKQADSGSPGDFVSEAQHFCLIFLPKS
jgi:hypothetical protein